MFISLCLVASSNEQLGTAALEISLQQILTGLPAYDRHLHTSAGQKRTEGKGNNQTFFQFLTASQSDHLETILTIDDLQTVSS